MWTEQNSVGKPGDVIKIARLNIQSAASPPLWTQPEKGKKQKPANCTSKLMSAAISYNIKMI